MIAFETIEARLGYSFQDRTLLETALTHKSFCNEHPDPALSNNERLEFLGDAVIDLIASHLLMERFPGRSEGELSKFRAYLVGETGLSAVAREIGIGEFLRMGRGEEQSGGREKSSLLGDALEAVVAAIYLDGGVPPCFELLEAKLQSPLSDLAGGRYDRDFKTRAQEFVQERMRLTPTYELIGTTGPDHEKVFEVALVVSGRRWGMGRGKSKKEAEQVAAERALEALRAEGDGEKSDGTGGGETT
ncbi:MAG: ribonuclease III [Deltaproteobacteria bacterium]|nr:ribonuclease III [Deltaproteobacteria bacterium]